MMFKAVLFDLDGTLLHLDTESFLGKYIKALSLKVKDHIPMEKFPKYLLESTHVMVTDNDGAKTNEEVFMEHFFKITQGDEKKLRPVFDSFYVEQFPALGDEYTGHPKAKEVIEHCKQKGLKIVLATNPVFPKAAILERLRWAGLSSEDFDVISCYEDMHFCKPNKNYFQELLDIIDVAPEHALMVGNDCQEDMVAGELGIKTFLVKDFIIDRGGQCHPDYQGDLGDITKII
ncbi:HAD family hydrolase [Alkalicella caledoniensis]|uniref:HAD family hydrolase n=1 Tax=Alkalicella caledoniensis TaxID=2731377 RepID=A0A7G9WAC4_ALKCA|nr:HAD family hydrolase [Alkalicella caledoniensis]QNO15636.1 HAD family hydrolase [Alkalicella caledoniensis]